MNGQPCAPPLLRVRAEISIQSVLFPDTMISKHSFKGTLACATLVLAVLSGAIVCSSFARASSTILIEPDQEFRATALDIETGDSIDFSYSASGVVSFTIVMFESGVVYSHEGASDDGRYTANETGSFELVFDNLEAHTVELTYSAVEVESGFGLGLVFVVGVIVAAACVVLGFFVVVITRKSRLPPL